MEELVNFVDEVHGDVKNMVQKWEHHMMEALNILDEKFFKKDIEENAKTPKQPKKKTKRLSVIMDEISDDESSKSVENLRPIRTAKGKAFANLKEPSGKTKMRRESIKKERISTNESFTKKSQQNHARKNKSKEIRKTTEQDSQLEKRKSNEENETDNETSVSTNKKLDKSDDSLIMITNNEIKIEIEILSDDEFKMPPPPVPRNAISTKKTKNQKNTEKKKSNQNIETTEKILSASSTSIDNKQSTEDCTTELRITRSRIKQEPVETSEDSITKSKRTKRGKKKESIKANLADTENIASNTIIITKKSTPASVSINGLIGEEQLENVKETPEAIEEDPEINKPSITDKNEKNNDAKSKTIIAIGNITQESVYEDAIAEIGRENVSKEFEAIYNQNVVVPLQKLPYENSNDRTFSLQDTTFNVNAVPIISSTSNNETFIFPTTQSTNNQAEEEIDEIKNSSLITEDASIPADESSNEIIEASTQSKFQLMKPTTLKNKNELFNPLIQSPVKKKVEAFEKHSNFGISPVPTRVTRTKTKEQKMQKENAKTVETTPLSKIGMPNIHQQFKKSFLSASKLAHVQHAVKLPSRDNSVEDMKRGLLAMAEEKKRKRDEKQRLAQQQREIKEKERIELAEKAAREREIKYKRLMQEKEEKLRMETAKKKLAKDLKMRENEYKKHLEEMQRNMKLQELKREEMIRLENQKRIDLQNAEAARREKEAFDSKLNAAKEEMQKKIQHKLINEKKKKKLVKAHDFEALNSGDSTDEEEKVSSKKPPPPEWSRSANRRCKIEIQSLVNTNVIDNFFSVQPMSPDLREIFPEIDSRYLKRNSSAVWNTPPRYSQMPKY